MNDLRVAMLSPSTVYKLFAIGMLTFFLPVSILAGILASLNLITLTWNEQTITGLRALVAAPVMGLVVALILTAVQGSMVAFGLWLYSKVRPLTIHYFPVADRPAAAGTAA